MARKNIKRPFSLLGLGVGGIPSRIEMMLENGGDLKVAENIERNVKRTGIASDDAKALSLLMAERAGTPPHVLRSLAYSLNLISPDTDEPLPPASVRSALGLPPSVKKFREFAEAAGRSALAIALTVRRDNGDLIDALNDLIGRVKVGRFALRDDALHRASKQQWEAGDDNKLVEMHARPGIARSTIKGWRSYPEFTHIVREVGGRIAIGLPPKASLSDQAIREISMKIPVDEVLAAVGGVATVWSLPPDLK